VNLPGPLVSPEWLAARIGREEPIAIADCRMVSGDPDGGRKLHAAAHIPGAFYFHLEEDLSGPEGEHGGRHPLPDPQALATKLSAAGIGPGVPIVAYDDAGQYASRFWWVLRWLGHDAVAVLDGGYPAWVAAGHPVTSLPSQPTPRAFVPQPRPHMVASMNAVKERPHGQVLVDARSPQRYAGEPDPLDPKPGHIPGAVNCYWQDGLRPDGTWRTAAEQAARFSGLPSADALIHSCGSGVTACANLLAMAIGGLTGSRLYVGSWSDWCSYPGNPVQ